MYISLANKINFDPVNMFINKISNKLQRPVYGTLCWISIPVYYPAQGDKKYFGIIPACNDI